MRANKIILLILICLFTVEKSLAQRAKNGSLTVTAANTIVNSYTALTANATAGTSSITVANNALNTGTVNFTFPSALAQGDLIMIIQMQGATMDINTYPVVGWGGDYTVPQVFFNSAFWVNPWEWGQITNYNNSGKYEVVEVLSVAGSTTINLTCALQHNYTVSGKTQIIRIPRFQDLTLNNATTIVPTNWLGQTGGVVALEVKGNVTLNTGAKITASGKGFRGATSNNNGNVVSCSLHGNGAGNGGTQLGSTTTGEGGRKGEGIGGFDTEYAALYSTYGRGAPANGGGGGGYQNSGGGGGSNVATGAHTGKGVPSTAFANTVWNLETAGLGGSTSAGGGRGGYSLSNVDQNELTIGPNNSAWCTGGAGGSGDARKENGGFGGHPLTYDATRLFMGGGGGAGDRNNNQGGSGGNGGGIVFLTCYGAISGSGSLEADGAVGQNTNPLNESVSALPSTNNKKGNDGAGGAGGGGSIVVKNGTAIGGTVALYARGGVGGNQVLTIGTGAGWEASGPGGGGGGGFTAVATGVPTQSVAGGASGTTNSTQVANFNVNGATAGSSGLTQSTSFFDLIPTNATICSGNTANLSVTVVGTAPGTITWYTQQFGGTAVGTGTTFTTPVLSTTTTYYVGVCPGTFRVPVVVTVTAGTTATFTQLGPFCSGQVFSLPTTSSNGFNGTWSPVVNTNATTTYTFTPAAGQCAIGTTMTVTINPSTTPTFTQVPAICSGGTFSLPTTSNNSITGTWLPAVNNTTTTTYTFTPAAGQCASTATMTVTVNANITPSFTQVAPICNGETFTLPTSSTNAVTGTWSPAINNTATTTYTFTPTAGQCATTTTMSVTVNAPTSPTFTQVAPICSGGTFTLPSSSNNAISGSWSPAINNTATTTYTFTPAAGQCASTATMTVVVGPPAVPTFTQVGPICSGQSFSLPSNSIENFAGAWSPAINNTSTTTYTFTPTAGQCATAATMTVTVNPNTTPLFNQIAPICSGGTITLLTTSTNGITGSWSPAINNAATTTYTFTPAAGQCATTATMTVTVNPSITPTFTQVAPICSGGVITLPTSSTNGVNGSWSPAINNTATTTYTFTPTAGQCATTVTMTITVNAQTTPNFAQVGPICSGGSFTLNTTSTNGITGSWLPAVNNTSTTTYTFTPTAGQCATTATMSVTVNPNVTPTFTQVAPVCSGGTITLPTTSTNGITGTWSPAINNTATTTYTFTPTAGLCATTTTMTVTVNQPITPTFTQVSAICSGGTISLPTTSNNAITGTWSPAVNNTATTTYTFTPGVGQCATTAPMTVTVDQPITPTFTQVAPICSGGSIVLNTTSDNSITGTWSPAINNTATTLYTFTPTAGQCATTATMTVSVGAPVTPTFTQVTPICSGGTFTLPTTATNGFTGSWSPAINNTATTTYTFTPTAGQCATTATMSVTVDPNITPTFTQVAPICNGGTFTLPTTANNAITGTWSPAINNTATTTYTFTPTAGLCATTAPMTVTVNQPTAPAFTQVTGICSGGTFTLPTTSNNAINGSWSPANNNTATTTYTFTPTAGQCAATATMTVTVSSPTTPTFTQVSPICNGGTFILPTTATNGFTGSWSPAINNTATTLYTFTPTAGQCANTSTMTVTVNSLPVIDMSTVAVSNENCNQSDGSIGGIQVNGGIPNYQYGWNTTPPSTTLSISGLSDGMYQLVVTDANGCLSTTSVQVGSNPAPQIDATGLNVTQPTCVDGGSISGITASGSAPLTYSWTGTSQTGSTLSNLQAGSYALTVTDAAGCTAQYGPIVLVNPVLPQADFTWTPTNPDVNTTVTFTDNSTGNGIVSYQWQIDGQALSGQQVSYTMDHEGEYIVELTITDVNGCSDNMIVTIPVYGTVTIPNVVTANNDGVNDLFIIQGLKPNTSVTILNRWGDLVFETNNYQNNWDGRDLSGVLLNEGVYTYILTTSNGTQEHGFIHLIR